MHACKNLHCIDLARSLGVRKYNYCAETSFAKPSKQATIQPSHAFEHAFDRASEQNQPNHLLGGKFAITLILMKSFTPFQKALIKQATCVRARGDRSFKNEKKITEVKLSIRIYQSVMQSFFLSFFSLSFFFSFPLSFPSFFFPFFLRLNNRWSVTARFFTKGIFHSQSEAI